MSAPGLRVALVQTSTALPIMLLLTLFSQWRPAWLIGVFTTEPAVIAVGAQFLQIISWNFVATGLNFTCSGLFQALGNTVPPLVGSATRLVTFALPAIWLARQPGFELKHLWLLSVATVLLQAAFNLWMLRREFGRRFVAAAAPDAKLSSHDVAIPIAPGTSDRD